MPMIFMIGKKRNMDINNRFGTLRSVGFSRRGPAYWQICLLVIALSCVAIAPVMAGDRYMAGSPDLSAYISGTNEIGPGDDLTLSVVIQNKGLNEFKFTQTGIMNRDDLPNTAKNLIASLDSGGAPLTVKSDPQMLGDLKASTSATASFKIKVDRDAAAGMYSLPVNLNYTYMYEADQYGTEMMQYYYKTINTTFQIPIKIKPEVQIDVLSVRTEHINVGNEGYLVLSIKNVGHENGQKAVIKLTRNGQSPVIPTESSAYVGDFPAGATADCRFKVTISSDAEAKTYPIDVYVDYKNSNGDFVTSDSDTIGVPVGKKVDFNITSSQSQVSPGEKKVIRVVFQNTGGATAYSVQARISAVDPFTSNDDTAFLGTLAPGESREADFVVSVDKAATVKEYGLDSEVRYRDALDNTVISNPMKVRVQVTPAKSIVEQLSNPLVLAIIAVVVIAGGYFLYRRRKKAE
jgi:hypothetical protein